MFPREARVRTSAEFEQIFTKGQAVHGTNLTVRTLPAQITRFGCIVGKRVSQKATVRNRTKRRLRASIRTMLPSLKKSADIVVIAKPGADNMSTAELTEELSSLFRKAKLI